MDYSIAAQDTNLALNKPVTAISAYQEIQEPYAGHITVAEYAVDGGYSREWLNCYHSVLNEGKSLTNINLHLHIYSNMYDSRAVTLCIA